MLNSADRPIARQNLRPRLPQRIGTSMRLQHVSLLENSGTDLGVRLMSYSVPRSVGVNLKKQETKLDSERRDFYGLQHLSLLENGGTDLGVHSCPIQFREASGSI